jgi:hypothetical protein
MRRNRPNRWSMTTGNILRSISSLSAAVVLVVFPTHVALAESAALRGHHVSRVISSSAGSGSHLTSAHPNAQAEPNIHPSGKFGVTPGAHEPEVHGTKMRAMPDNAGMNEQASKQTGKMESRGAPKNGDVRAPSSTETGGKAPNPIESRARDVNTIDTRIFAPSRGLKGRADNIREPRMPIKIVTTRSLTTRRKTVPGAVHGVAHNAVGIPNTQSGAAKPYVGKSALPDVAATPVGIDRSAPMPTDGIVRPPNVVQLNPVSAITSVASNHGMINGTGLVRIGSGAAVIGGPAKVVVGLNGTTIRLKH